MNSGGICISWRCARKVWTARQQRTSLSGSRVELQGRCQRHCAPHVAGLATSADDNFIRDQLVRRWGLGRAVQLSGIAQLGLQRRVDTAS